VDNWSRSSRKTARKFCRLLIRVS